MSSFLQGVGTDREKREEKGRKRAVKITIFSDCMLWANPIPLCIRHRAVFNNRNLMMDFSSYTILCLNRLDAWIPAFGMPK
ncbi:hypothetical protein CLI74_07990 [Porphyromonas gingivalis]|nr:hypothetical protein CS059_02770 [Porphyromonas gingivalis]PDP55857.1 hypothetical protein CLI74_07990 [Porphyromonas gingivalis]